MNSLGVTAFEPFETDLWEEVEANDLDDGDLWIVFDFDEAASPFCFLIGESPLLNVKVLLRGRSRFEEPPDVVCSGTFSSSVEPSRDFDDLVSAGLPDCLPFVSPTEECADVVRDACGVSSL